ncbi:MAG: Unknown protein [uncultured Sulfurovum sp.]|uniref:Uncharacterized protein n=1 Tax=uncultured Sulfurovum sp. TaxID=269237 RepID=A0A6S6SH56_9BACT|nr:MAG: Unknown protein [uncultured Sulfurovum sp.]
MAKKEEKYTFPWGFHIGDLCNKHERMPLYTPTNDGGFCLLYDKTSEKKADTLLESLTLELLSTMPYESLTVDLFDFGKKKFYSLSPLQYVQTYKVSHNKEMIEKRFTALEKIVISRHKELLCCNRQTINEHNKKSKIQKDYHLVLINLENFPNDQIERRRVKNFIESAYAAGVYVIAFTYHDTVKNANESVQSILKHFKNIKVSNGEFIITEKIFEFMELLEDHDFEALDLDKDLLLQKAMNNADLEGLVNPENIKLEVDTKVK